MFSIEDAKYLKMYNIFKVVIYYPFTCERGIDNNTAFCIADPLSAVEIDHRLCQDLVSGKTVGGRASPQTKTYNIFLQVSSYELQKEIIENINQPTKWRTTMNNTYPFSVKEVTYTEDKNAFVIMFYDQEVDPMSGVFETMEDALDQISILEMAI